MKNKRIIDIEMPGQLGHNPAVLAFFKPIFQPLFWHTPSLPDPHKEPVLPILQLLPGYSAKGQSCLENGILFPGILFLIPFHDHRELIQISLRKLGFNGPGNLFRCVGVYIIKTFLNGIGEFLDDLWIFFYITLFCTVGGVRYITGICS